MNRDNFAELEQQVLALLCKRMKRLRYRKNVFERESAPLSSIKDSEDVLHKHFVIVPVDKASNKFAIICKNYTSIFVKGTRFSYVKCNSRW